MTSFIFDDSLVEGRRAVNHIRLKPKNFSLFYALFNVKIQKLNPKINVKKLFTYLNLCFIGNSNNL